MNTKLIEKLDEVIKDIKNTEQFITYKELKNEIEKTHSKEIEMFEKAKTEFKKESVNIYSKEYKLAALKLSESKKELYEKELVKKYIVVENSINDFLNEVLKKITSSISTHISIPNEIGIFTKKEGFCD